MKTICAIAVALTLVAVTAPASARILCGTLRYDDYTYNPNSDSTVFIGAKPIRYAKVAVHRPGYFYVETVTNSSGFYSVSVADSLTQPNLQNYTLYMTVDARITGVATVSNHLGGYIGFTKTKTLTGSAGTFDLSYTVPQTIGSSTVKQSAVFNILDNIHNAYTYAGARRHSAQEEPISEVTVRYPDNPPSYSLGCPSGCSCTYNSTAETDRFGSGYIPATRCSGNPTATIHISGGPNSYIDWTPIHEYAHHLQYVIGRPEPMMTGNMPSICNSLPTDAHAWHEGFAHYFAAAVLGQSVFGHTNVESCNFDVETPRSCPDATCASAAAPAYGKSMQAVYLSLWDLHDATNEWHDRVNGASYYPGIYGTVMAIGGYPADWIFRIFDGPMDWYTSAAPDIFQFRSYWIPYSGSFQDLNLVFAKHKILPPACNGMCGSYQPDMACYCDADCVGYGDCCGDGSACSSCGVC